MPERGECPPNTFRYVIAPRDTIYGLAVRFKTTVSAILSANPFVEPTRLFVGQVLCIPRQQIFPPCPEGNYYALRRGDTLWAIARFFNISLDDLLEANPAIDPNRLRVGQVICIPVATPPVRRCPEGADRYVIRSGDTFYSLARRFNVSLDSLLRANPRVNPDALLVGQQICVPVGD